MNDETLIPVAGCWVRRSDGSNSLGQVVRHDQNGSKPEVEVDWGQGRRECLTLSELRSGFQPDWTVQDVPRSTTRRSLGQGRVVGRRKLGGREQILVQLDETGQSVWLPYENLRRIKDVVLRYERAETGVADHAERLRLRLLAHALENWNSLTGALDRLDVDPLPHQIQLVHKIVSSGNFNWLIADDVGLGKTIEVGLLLAALKRKNLARRVLIVAPAGLVRQWQDELKYKFDQDYFIYGHDVHINKPEQWKLYDHVIVSIDLAKRENHMEIFRSAGAWDVVVFDEGHKLTRHASGERAERFKLAEMLRPLADAFLLLSGTPHQGYVDRFIALLELVRPDLRREVRALEANPEIVSEMILRNRKSEVTDADGQFIFRGQRIHRVPVEPSPETKAFQRQLHIYLRKGYRAGEGAGAAGRAIGFVMTIYRKLASSSIAAIERALTLRLHRLRGDLQAAEAVISGLDLAVEELEEGGDNQDDLSSTLGQTSTEEFFADEESMIEDLLLTAKTVRRNDEKLRLFLEDVVKPLVAEGKKLLVFTEYRATQAYLKEALESRFSHAGDVVLINGSMSLEEKLESIAAFDESAAFMVSTEAGGEGLNLHRACHVMVNYDLPWNPARLVQRIGRLYRYGQELPVVVFNMHARDSFDNSAIDLMLQRVTQIVQDMAPVGPDFHDRLHAEILGDILENVNLTAILRSAADMEIERTSEQIEEAVNKAREAKRLQDEILTHVSGYDPSGLEGTLGFTMQHVDLFVRGMLPLLNVNLDGTLYEGSVLEVRLPEEFRGRFREFGGRTAVRITTNRRVAHRARDVVLLDFETQFFQFLIETAKSQAFDGLYASTHSRAVENGVLAAFKVRWQNDQGSTLLEEFIALFAESDGTISRNPSFLTQWLVSSLHSVETPDTDRNDRRHWFQQLWNEANRHLELGNTRFKHPNGIVPLAAADCRDGNLS